MDAARPTDASPLVHAFPRIAQLSRDELRELVETPANTHEARDQAAYVDALLHTLPDVRALYDEHEQLLHDVELAAGTHARVCLTQLKTSSCAPRCWPCALRPARRTMRHVPPTRRGPQSSAKWTKPTRFVRYSLTKRFTPAALQTRLQLAMNEVHDESETLANAYVEGLPTSAAGDVIDVRCTYCAAYPGHYVRSAVPRAPHALPPPRPAP